MSHYKKLFGIGSTLFVINGFYNTNNDTKSAFLMRSYYPIMCETVKDSSKNPKDLVFSTVYFRHGTRTPLKKLRLFPELLWPKEMCEIDTSSEYLPYKIINVDDCTEGRPHSYFDEIYTSIELPGGCASGHLTKKGQQDSHNLGQTLKHRYVDEFKLIDNVYNPDSIYSYTTNINRTLDSMQAVLKGIFGDTINSENVAIINTRPNEVEHNLPNSQFCERIGRWMNYAYSAQYTLRVCDGLREKLSKLFKDPSDIPQPLELWDTVASMKSNGFKIPQEYEELYPEIEKCASHVEKFAVYGEVPETMCQSFGKIIDDILRHFEHVVAYNDNHISHNNSKLKLNLTACHDTTIFALLTAMGGFNEKWPTLSGYIAFELYKEPTDNNHYVRVIYNGEIVRSSGTDIDGFIQLDKFSAKHEKIRMRDDFKDFCRPYPPLDHK